MKGIELSEFDVRIETVLPQEVTGQAIIEATKKVIKARRNSFYSKGFPFAMIGQASEYPSEDLIIEVGEGETKVDPVKLYTKLTVVSYDHPGLNYAVGTTESGVIKAMTDFRDALVAEL